MFSFGAVFVADVNGSLWRDHVIQSARPILTASRSSPHGRPYLVAMSWDLPMIPVIWSTLYGTVPPAAGICPLCSLANDTAAKLIWRMLLIHWTCRAFSRARINAG